MRCCDWSSDVCSSDLARSRLAPAQWTQARSPSSCPGLKSALGHGGCLPGRNRCLLPGRHRHSRSIGGGHCHCAFHAAYIRARGARHNTHAQLRAAHRRHARRGFNIYLIIILNFFIYNNIILMNLIRRTLGLVT